MKTTDWVVVVLGVVLANAAQAASHGKSVYERTCIACHGKNGKGAIPGVPPLGGKGGRLEKPDPELIRNTINGMRSPGSSLGMPPKGGDPSLTEQDAAAVLQYMRQTFGPDGAGGKP